jgi:hypothetical protein
MAREPFTGLPDVQQQGPVDVFEHAQATPQEFGAGVGQAEQGLARAGEQASDLIAQNAQRLQELTNNRNANQAINGYMRAAGEEFAKYGAMEGQAQHDYYPTFQKNLSDLRDQFGSSLQSPMAQQQYNDNSRLMTTRYFTAGAEYAARGLKQSYALTNQQTAESALNQGIIGQNDPVQVALAATRAGGAARDAAVNLHGATPEQADAEELKGRSAYYAKLIVDMARSGNVGTAQQYYQTVRPNLDGDSIAEIDRELKPATDRASGQAAAHSVYGSVVGVNSARPDPVVRGAIIDQAKRSGIDPSVPLTVAQIESSTGGKPDAPGNPHQGIFQLGPQEWSQIGGTAANRGDKVAQSQLGTQWVVGAQKAATDIVGRPAEGWETYIVHQQGTAGGRALLTAPAGESAVDALAPAYNGNRDTATRAITNNGGSPDMSAQQFTQMWQARYARAASQVSGNNLPTSGDARPPLTGDQILEATQRIDNDPRLTPEAAEYGHRIIEQQLSAYNQALRADAENAINGFATKILQNPQSVSQSDIAQNPFITGAEKFSLSGELVRLQSGKAQGDGDQFGDVVGRIQAPVGDDNRINSPRDLVPMLGHGLTYSGLQKAQSFIKDRDAPDGPTLKAAMDTWKSQILGGAWGDPKQATPGTRQRWVDFLAAVQPTIDQAKGKMPMAEIVGANGPVQKMIETGHYVLSGEEMFQSMIPGGTPAQGAPQAAPVVGHWYMPVGNFSGQFREVPAGTPGARRLTAPAFSPQNFENPTQADPPSAAITER